MQATITVPRNFPIARKVQVAIRATDSVTHAGLASFLGSASQLVVHSSDAEHANAIVVAVESVDVSTLRTLRDLSSVSTARFVLVLDKQSDVKVSTVIECGVRAILWRPSLSPAAFVQAVAAVGNGGGLLSPSMQGMLMEQVQQIHRGEVSPGDLVSAKLSDRETELLRLLSEGLGLEDVAQQMCYSERTVKNILYGAMKRLGLRNRTHAVSYAIRSGLI